MRCPSCGAHNPDSASWCTQCYASFEAEPTQTQQPPDVEPTDVGPTDVEPTAVDVAAPPGEPVPVPADDAAADRRFRRSEDGVDWRCASCDTWSPIERSTCPVCGTALHATLDPAREAGPRDDVSVAAVVVASLLLPGAGHVLLGSAAAGAGRMFLYIVWGGGGIALLTAAAGADGSVLPALPLLTGAFVLMATSVLDALALRRGDLGTEVLSARALLWLTVGVIGLTTLALIGSALSVSG